MQTFTRSEYQVIWLVGVLERLASLGLIAEPPSKLAPETLDLYLELDSDSMRYNLFDSEKEILALFDCMVHSEFPATPKDVMEGIGNMVLEYKNNRYNMVKYCLEQQYQNQ